MRPTTLTAPLLVLALSLALYITTLAPTVYNLDSAELTTASYTGGLVRSTGYPLYLLVGRFWSRLPIGDVGYRMNLLSALCGALTLVVLERLLAKLGVGPWARAGAVGLLAVSHFFWALSLIAEVYTPQTLIQCAFMWSLLHWLEHPRERHLTLVGTCLGLGLAHHLATVLWAPGVLWVLARQRRSRRWRHLALALLPVVGGLALYFYLTLLQHSAPAFDYVGEYNAGGRFQRIDLSTLSGMWWLASGQRFASDFGGYDASGLLVQLGRFLVELWRAFAAIGIGPGLLGAFVLTRRRPDFGGALLLMFGAHTAFFASYRVIDKSTMFLPSYLIWAVWLGVGYQTLFDWIREESNERWVGSALALVRGLVLAGVVWAGLRGGGVDLSNDWSARHRGERVLRFMEPNALLCAGWATAPVVEYLQLVEHQRADVRTINRFLISDENLWPFLEVEVERRPVYLDAPTLGTPALEVVADGPLFRVVRRASIERPAGQGPADQVP